MLNAKNYWIAIIFPLVLIAQELPKMFADKMIQHGAVRLVEVSPILMAIENNKIYPENPDTCFTFDTYWDSMSGNSLRIRQIYNRFNLIRFIQDSYSVQEEYFENYDETEAGRSFIQNNFKNFVQFLKKKKSLFWTAVKKECTKKHISFRKVKNQFDLALDYEKGILNDLLKADENNLEKMAEAFKDQDAEIAYLAGYGDEGTMSDREKVNGLFLSMKGLHQWKSLTFVTQADGQVAVDHAWFFTIAMMVKYKNGTYKETLQNFKCVANAID